MNKNRKIIVIIVALIAIIIVGYEGFGWKNYVRSIDNVANIANTSVQNTSIKNAAWAVMQNYISAAKSHDLSAVRSLSYKLSTTCTDPTKQVECFGLMDNVAMIASTFTIEEFKNVYADDKQIIMHTDEPEVKILYFLNDPASGIKLLGIRFCFDTKETTGECIRGNVDRNDDDNDGLWNSIEELI